MMKPHIVYVCRAACLEENGAESPFGYLVYDGSWNILNWNVSFVTAHLRERLASAKSIPLDIFLKFAPPADFMQIQTDDGPRTVVRTMGLGPEVQALIRQQLSQPDKK